MRYLLAQVGCLECSVPTTHHGIYDDLAGATEAAKSATAEQDWGHAEVTVVGPDAAVSEKDYYSGPWHGQAVWVAFEVPDR